MTDKNLNFTQIRNEVKEKNWKNGDYKNKKFYRSIDLDL